MTAYWIDEEHYWGHNPAGTGKETPMPTTGGFSYGQYRNTKANTPNPHPAPAPPITFTTTDPWRNALARLAPGAFAERTDEGTSESQLEVVEDDMPILAQRVARLRFAGDGKFWQSIGGTATAFGIDTKAECKNQLYSYAISFEESGHAAPDPDCTCGFYATPLGNDLYTYEPYLVTLLVELSGDVVECERMYRAGHQRVIECRLPRCLYCAAPAQIIRAVDGLMTHTACDPRHLYSKKGVLLTVEDLEQLLPVPVTHADPPA